MFEMLRFLKSEGKRVLRVLSFTIVFLSLVVCLGAFQAIGQTGEGEEEAEMVDLESTGPSRNSPIPNDEFRALAYAQLDAIALMCNYYFLENGEYPPDLYELMASNYWLADMNNIFTGEPIQQVLYTPADRDFVKDPYGFNLSQQTDGAGGDREEGDQSGESGDAGGGSQSSGTGIYQVYRVPPRLDPGKIGLMEPGNILYFGQGSASLQMIMWMNGEVYEEYYQTVPTENAITRHQLAKRISPSDDVVLATAVLVEEVLPRSYSRWQFYAGLSPLLPKDLEFLTWSERLEIFDTLQIYPRNPLARARITLVKDFRIGMIADLDDDAIPPVYCMYGSRLRTLKEMTDIRYLAEHMDEVIERELGFGAR